MLVTSLGIGHEADLGFLADESGETIGLPVEVRIKIKRDVKIINRLQTPIQSVDHINILAHPRSNRPGQQANSCRCIAIPIG